ncbi:MAG TPA: molybdate ABC transporter permease subunit [Burkholderiales bacterium]|nr:molybdate ABC transporter permease subunit [Burkholderiales bacterium]
MTVDWQALALSLQLAVVTAAIMLPLSIWAGRTLAWRQFAGKAWVEALVALPLVLPPTVLGYYLLTVFAPDAALGGLVERLSGVRLAFSFEGLVLASILFNLPFAIQPAQRAFEAIPQEVREAAWLCGMSEWRTLWRVELPLAWPGVLTALVLTFAHTLGEFGVVLMIGGNIPGETKTIAIAIYDRVQAFDDRAAGVMSGLLLAISFVAIATVYWFDRLRRRHG